MKGSDYAHPCTMFKTNLLILSDTCCKDPSLDKVIPTVRSLFKSPQYSSCLQLDAADIISDNVDDIQYKISHWCEDPDVRLILTSGGTGFTGRDQTPEAVKPLLEKEAPGIVHAMISESLKVTPFAMMSRPVAGVKNKALIVTLPGSPKAVVENLNAIISALPHALAQIDGQDSRALHAKFQRTFHGGSPGGDSKKSGDGVKCHHSVHSKCGISKHKLVSNDPDQPVTLRARESPYEMVSVDEALGLVTEKTPSPIVEQTYLKDSVGSTASEDILSPTNVPNFRASIVDGYAVVSSDGPGKYPVVSVSHANASLPSKLESGQIARITTGAPLPDGADSVVMVEETVLCEMTEDNAEEKVVEILASDVMPNDNVREIGSDVAKGTVLLKKGSRVSQTGGEIGLLSSVGVGSIPVYKRPVIGVLSTGDELVNAHGPVSYGQVYDSNRPSLLSIVSNQNLVGVDLGIAKDKKGTLANVMREAFTTHDVDYLITTGGVSMGELDLLKPTIERELGGEIHFGRVKMKPGKPTTFATVKVGEKTRVIFALPGNPASAIVCFFLFVLPSIRQFSGDVDFKSKTVKVRLAADVKLDPRPEYQRAKVFQVKRGEYYELLAETTGMQRSSRVGSFEGANALLCLPSGKGVLSGGEVVDAILIGPL